MDPIQNIAITFFTQVKYLFNRVKKAVTKNWLRYPLNSAIIKYVRFIE